MVVVRLPNGSIQLHNPNPISPELLSDLQPRGRIGSIVTPTLFHDTYLEDVLRLFSECKLYASPDLKVSPDLTNARRTFAEWPESWLPVLRPIQLRGTTTQETAFYHAPTRSLLVSDLVMNFGREAPLFTRLFFRLNGVNGQLRPTRIFRQTITDRAAFLASIDELLQLDFDRLIPTHGSMVETGAKERFKREFKV